MPLQPVSKCALALGHLRSLNFLSSVTGVNLRTAWPALLRVALQNRCFLCGNMSHLEICRDCELEALEDTLDDAPRCACCALTLAGIEDPSQRCSRCVVEPPAFDATLAFADYSAPYDSLALALKFSARLNLAGWFARKLAQLAHYADVQPDLIIPVPLARSRLAQRGFNQAWEVARVLGRLLDANASATIVTRTRSTLPQSALADVQSRRDNVQDAFSVARYQGFFGRKRIRSLDGLHLAVVDDVMTSGATLNALAQQLKQAGAARVTNLVALRTPAAYSR
ncbi:ComF family protein [Burkholderia sp. L27(2015)]|uniref:ComF family protein n=1 Tax=Burkholderia sp. L27(2015) TaxID=1641858 RepID=UPI0020B10E80|nr:ComF family protein [Burkholderia sp. L27(2015)]